MKHIRKVLKALGDLTKDGSNARWIISLAIVIVGLVVSVYLWNSSQAHVQNEVTTKYQRQMSLIESLLILRLQQYGSLLNGGAGLFAANPSTTQADWVAYYKTYDLQHDYPGVDAVSFSQYVTNANLPSYLAGLAAQGRPSMTIWPAGNRPAYAPVTYIAALSPVSLESFGYDPLSDATRREAMMKAQNMGTVVMTSKISLIAAHKGQAAFIIYKPVYMQPANTVAARQNAIYGYVFAATNANNLFDNILGQVQTTNYAFQIFDGTNVSNDTLMYQASNFTMLRKEAIKIGTTPFTFDDHTWTIQLAAAPGIIPTSERAQPILNFLRGILATLSVASVVWYFITSREHRFARLQQREVQAVKDNLLSLASHQLRTPATIVKQHIGILLHNYAGDITQQQRKLLEAAYKSNERQLEIINQFLNAARLEPGNAELHLTRINCNALLETIVQQQQNVCTEREQTFSYKLPKRQVYLMGDAQYLPVVFENLLSNASKYTPKGGSISLGMHRRNSMVRISVTDTGIGLSEDEQEIIFDKFTRIHNDFTADANGSGIGLYLARQIVILHDGSIAVTSTPGKGSSFIVELPATP